MATKTVKDLEDLRALLAEVQALREDIETKGAELRREWGVAAERANSRATISRTTSRCAVTTSTTCNSELSARGLSSLGRSEAKVAATLDVLIVTLRRLTGETNVPYPGPALARARAPRSWKPSPTVCSASARGAPRACG